MSDIDNIIQRLKSSTVEEDEEKEVSFVGQGLSLDTEEDADVIVKAINDCPRMTTLRLEGNTVGIPAAKAIMKALQTQSSFRKALWKDMFTRRDKDEIPKALEHLSDGIMLANAQLVVLDLSDNAFGPRGLVGLQRLLESPSCYNLQELHLNNNGLGISGAKLLSSAICKCITNSRTNGTLMQLKVFVCGRNRLENAGAIEVSKFLKEFGSLESVALPQNGIYHEGVKALCEAFASNPKLKAINLEDNSLTEDGAKCIADILPSLKDLELLNLGDCLVRTSGAIFLGVALERSCAELREINLGFNEISAEGGEAIIDAMRFKDKLVSLCLNGNKFGDAGCESIIERMTAMGKADDLGSLSEDEGDSCDEEEGETEEEGDIEDDIHDLKELDGSLHKSPLHKSSIHESPMHKSPLHESPMCKITAKEFLSSPTSKGLNVLFNSNETFSSVIPAAPGLSDYIDLFFKISLVVTPTDESAKTAACKYADDLLSKAYGAAESIKEFNDTFLVGIGLLKGEFKSKRWH